MRCERESASIVVSACPPTVDHGMEVAPGAATIERVARFHGGGLRVVSTHLATSAGSDSRRVLRTKADSLLHEIRSLGDDRSLDHAVRMSLRADVQRID